MSSALSVRLIHTTDAFGRRMVQRSGKEVIRLLIVSVTMGCIHLFCFGWAPQAARAQRHIIAEPQKWWELGDWIYVCNMCVYVSHVLEDDWLFQGFSSFWNDPPDGSLFSWFKYRHWGNGGERVMGGSRRESTRSGGWGFIFCMFYVCLHEWMWTINRLTHTHITI